VTTIQTTTTLTPVQVVRLTKAAPAQKARWPVADVAALFELPFNDLNRTGNLGDSLV